MVGPDQYSIERLEERPWLKIMLLCYRKYRVLEIIFVGARIYDACQLKNGLSLFPFALHGTGRYRFDLSCPIGSFLQPVLKTLIVGISLTQTALDPTLLLYIKSNNVWGDAYLSQSCGASTLPTDFDTFAPVLSRKCS